MSCRAVSQPDRGSGSRGSAGHEDAERVPGRVGVHPERFLGVVGAVVEQSGAEGQGALVLDLEVPPPSAPSCPGAAAAAECCPARWAPEAQVPAGRPSRLRRGSAAPTSPTRSGQAHRLTVARHPGGTPSRAAAGRTRPASAHRCSPAPPAVRGEPLLHHRHLLRPRDPAFVSLGTSAKLASIGLRRSEAWRGSCRRQPAAQPMTRSSRCALCAVDKPAGRNSVQRLGGGPSIRKVCSCPST